MDAIEFVRGEEEVSFLAGELLEYGGKYPIWLFIGDLGAGKTTLIKEIVRQSGIEEVVKSPTFNIVHEYGNRDKMIYHFDFYRLKDAAEAEEIGVDEYFFSGKLCLIEWPEVVMNLIPEPFLIVKIEHTPDHKRRYIFLDHEQENWI